MDPQTRCSTRLQLTYRSSTEQSGLRTRLPWKTNMEHLLLRRQTIMPLHTFVQRETGKKMLPASWNHQQIGSLLPQLTSCNGIHILAHRENRQKAKNQTNTLEATRSTRHQSLLNRIKSQRATQGGSDAAQPLLGEWQRNR